MSLKTFLLGAALTLASSTAAMAEIEIHHAYARASTPVAGAAFMVIHNTSDANDRLIGVASDIAARTELHTHQETDDGVMRMIHLEEGRALPAGGTLVLQRGGDHVMFMGLAEPLVQDAQITVTLIFETAGEVQIDLPVDQTRLPMDHSAMDHDTDHDMDHSDTEQDADH